MAEQVAITVSPAAEKFMRRMVRFSDRPEGAGFRLCVSLGGCSGLSSGFSVQTDPEPGDATLVINGLRIFLPAASCNLLQGATIDCVDTPLQSGLTFIHPQVQPCACGSSAAAGHGHVPAVATVAVGSIRMGRPA